MTVHPSAPGNLNWRWSSSCEGGACVMVARHGDLVVFGNGAEPDGPVYVYTVDEWRQFIVGAKAGDFDDLASLRVEPTVGSYRRFPHRYFAAARESRADMESRPVPRVGP